MIVSIFGSEATSRSTLAHKLATVAEEGGCRTTAINGQDAAEWPNLALYYWYKKRNLNTADLSTRRHLGSKIVECYRVAAACTSQLVIIDGDPLYEEVIKQQSRKHRAASHAAAMIRLGFWEWQLARNELNLPEYAIHAGVGSPSEEQYAKAVAGSQLYGILRNRRDVIATEVMVDASYDPWQVYMEFMGEVT